MRTVTTLVAALLLLVSWSIVGSANTGTVKILGDEHFVPNAMIMATFRFAPGPLSTSSGSTVTWDNTGSGASADEPHTITVVKQSELPASIDQVFGCGGPGTGCARAFVARDASGNCPAGSFAPPGAPVCVWVARDVGGQGLNAVGDSFLVGPHDTISLTVTAGAGTKLYYMCGIHPWMQGSIDVH
jgi:plastocyanin